jgi:hypothetical protein
MLRSALASVRPPLRYNTCARSVYRQRLRFAYSLTFSERHSQLLLRGVQLIRCTHFPRRRTFCVNPVSYLLVSQATQLTISLVKRFAEDVVGPKVREMDENEMMDPSVINGLFEQGVRSSSFPSLYLVHVRPSSWASKQTRSMAARNVRSLPQ